MKRVRALLPGELFNNCSEQGREMKPQTLVLCGEAHMFQSAREDLTAEAWPRPNAASEGALVKSRARQRRRRRQNFHSQMP